MSSRTALRSRGAAVEGVALDWNDIGQFCNALAAARGQFASVTETISEEFSLGPRGPWIVSRIGKGSASPQALARLFEIGPSLMTSELNRLAEAGLIRQRKSPEDGRKVVLSLTQKGERVRRRVGEELEALFAERLGAYSRDDIRFCAALLDAFSRKPVS